MKKTTKQRKDGQEATGLEWLDTARIGGYWDRELGQVAYLSALELPGGDNRAGVEALCEALDAAALATAGDRRIGRVRAVVAVAEHPEHGPVWVPGIVVGETEGDPAALSPSAAIWLAETVTRLATRYRTEHLMAAIIAHLDAVGSLIATVEAAGDWDDRDVASWALESCFGALADYPARPWRAFTVADWDEAIASAGGFVLEPSDGTPGE